MVQQTVKLSRVKDEDNAFKVEMVLTAGKVHALLAALRNYHTPIGLDLRQMVENAIPAELVPVLLPRPRDIDPPNA